MLLSSCVGCERQGRGAAPKITISAGTKAVATVKLSLLPPLALVRASISACASPRVLAVAGTDAGCDGACIPTLKQHLPT